MKQNSLNPMEEFTNKSYLLMAMDDNLQPGKDKFIDLDFMKRNQQSVGTGDKIVYETADADVLLSSRLGPMFDLVGDTHLDKSDKVHIAKSSDSSKKEKDSDLISELSNPIPSSTKAEMATSPTQGVELKSNEDVTQAVGVGVSSMMASFDVSRSLDAAQVQVQAVGVSPSPMMASVDVSRSLDAAQVQVQAVGVSPSPMMASDAFLNDFDDFVSADTIVKESDSTHVNKDDALLTMKLDGDVIAEVTEVSSEATDTTDNQPDLFFGTTSAFSSSPITHVEPEVNEVTDINHKLNLSTSGVSLSKESVPESVPGLITDDDDKAMTHTPLSSNPVCVTGNILNDAFGEDSAPRAIVPDAVQQTIDDEDEWDDFEEADVSPNIDAALLSTPVISTTAVEFKEHSSSSSASFNLGQGGQSYLETPNARNNDHSKEAEFLLGDAAAPSTNEVKHMHMVSLHIMSMIDINDLSFYWIYTI